MTFSRRLLPVFVLVALAACPLAAFDTPCKTGHGVSVSIPGFQDSIYTNSQVEVMKSVQLASIIAR